MHNIDVAYNLVSFNHALKDFDVEVIDCGIITCSDANNIHSISLIINMVSYIMISVISMCLIINECKR